ncbi:MAG: Putative pre-16S rRNA nuclease Yqg [uncultured Acidimicrobiales bacterium]|uniref:Putative pre-16S rRNA nuclease n=1 Tax=uncultured Acidimicrobiales bacterium TaxID=310071 RepID=A0A6J4GZT2_9ACTN|nr:MAG: Putative pre-16S rRNA nuclease Yqg [uncultured Acidimicrobiales bacterium]
MRTLGVDLGSVRVGVALSDPDGILALPLAVLPRSTDLLERLADLVVEHDVGAVVVGLPRSLDGRERQTAMAARREATALAERVGVPVHLQDERLSTVVAHGAMAAAGRTARQRRGSVDASAAAVLLQSWLESPAGRRPEEGPGS